MKQISKIYYNLIRKGEKTLDDVPNEEIKQEVKRMLDDEGDDR